MEEKLMQLKTKKIIAREGLTIIVILLLSGLFWLAYEWMNGAERNLRAELELRLDEIKEIENKSINEIPEDVFREKYSDELHALKKIKLYDKNAGIVEIVGFIVLLAVYPLTLLIRFILWAISTLKQ